MASFGSSDEATQIGSELVSYVEANHPIVHPMNATAGMAIALGAMVAAMAQLGLTKPGRSGHLLKHLFALAEQHAEQGMED